MIDFETMLPALALGFLMTWVQVRSETFIVKSSAGPERARQVLTELERFHQTVGAVLFSEVERPEFPVEVLVFRDPAEFRRLAPLYQGKRIDVAGYFQRAPDRDFILLSARAASAAVIYHELTHYFLNRGLAHRPAWLNEGLAEYFSVAVIGDDSVRIGGIVPERLQILRQQIRPSLPAMFAVDFNSPDYNEGVKANVFYAQAWAFVHYMMHGEYRDNFRKFLAALSSREASLLSFLPVSERELEARFMNYLASGIRRTAPQRIPVPSANMHTTVETITDDDAEVSVAEVFLAQGDFEAARPLLERASSGARQGPRASYYRGLLARVKGEDSRDYFLSALLDPDLAPRAAIHLVQLGDTTIPSVRAVLEEAVRSRSRVPAIHLALADIYAEDVRRIESEIRMSRLKHQPPPRMERTPEPAAVPLSALGSVTVPNFRFTYQAFDAASAPPVFTVEPYYPDELRKGRTSGSVTVDVQVARDGSVSALWLVQSTPDLLGSLATGAIRQWRFPPGESRVRVVVEFMP